MRKAIEIRRGDVVVVNLEPTMGIEQRGKKRPCLVVQNDVGNRFARTTIVIPLTDSEGKEVYPFQALLRKGEGGLRKSSIAKCEQIRTIDRTRISKRLGRIDNETMSDVKTALRNSLAL